MGWLHEGLMEMICWGECDWVCDEGRGLEGEGGRKGGKEVGREREKRIPSDSQVSSRACSIFCFAQVLTNLQHRSSPRRIELGGWWFSKLYCKLDPSLKEDGAQQETNYSL